MLVLPSAVSDSPFQLTEAVGWKLSPLRSSPRQMYWLTMSALMLASTPLFTVFTSLGSFSFLTTFTVLGSFSFLNFLAFFVFVVATRPVPGCTEMSCAQTVPGISMTIRANNAFFMLFICLNFFNFSNFFTFSQSTNLFVMSPYWSMRRSRRNGHQRLTCSECSRSISTIMLSSSSSDAS